VNRLIAIIERFAAPALTVGGILLLAASFSLASCAGEDMTPHANWKVLEPPRAGLRCWHSHTPGYGVFYCEPDPSATHGAGQ
jgi:hypothetical protein